MAQNELAAAVSPYLLQHKDNPVHWRMWGEAALAEARRLNRPILLSIGYAACHWCHVMAHESFEDAGVAAVMNELFINIKVDREERPDIDEVYMAALARPRSAGRLAADHVPDADRRTFLGRHVFSEGGALRTSPLSSTSCAPSRRPITPNLKKWRRTPRRCAPPSSRQSQLPRMGRSRHRRSTSTRSAWPAAWIA